MARSDFLIYSEPLKLRGKENPRCKRRREGERIPYGVVGQQFPRGPPSLTRTHKSPNQALFFPFMGQNRVYFKTFIYIFSI